jgi:hypothetical protein
MRPLYSGKPLNPKPETPLCSCIQDDTAYNHDLEYNCHTQGAIFFLENTVLDVFHTSAGGYQQLVVVSLIYVWTPHDLRLRGTNNVWHDTITQHALCINTVVACQPHRYAG